MLRLRRLRVQRFRLRARCLAHDTARAHRKHAPAACSAADGRRARTAAAPGYARAKQDRQRVRAVHACACTRTCGSAARRRGTGAAPLPQRQPPQSPSRFRRRWRPPRAPPRTSRPPPQAACAATPAAAPGGAAMLQRGMTMHQQRGSISDGGQHARDFARTRVLLRGHDAQGDEAVCEAAVRGAGRRRSKGWQPPRGRRPVVDCRRRRCLRLKRHHLHAAHLRAAARVSSANLDGARAPRIRDERARLVSVFVKYGEDEAHEALVQLLIRALRAHICARSRMNASASRRCTERTAQPQRRTHGRWQHGDVRVRVVPANDARGGARRGRRRFSALRRGGQLLRRRFDLGARDARAT